MEQRLEITKSLNPVGKCGKLEERELTDLENKA